MRYGSEHKEETRRKVVTVAAAVLREQGPDRLGVAEVMKRAGLTHGGFYAHFPSKDALLGAAIEEAFMQGRARFERADDGRSPAQALGFFVDQYVSMSHRSRPQTGCPLTSLANDIPRQAAPARDAFDRGVAGLIARLARRMPAGAPDERPDIARSCVAEMAGAVALSRAISDDAEAERILDQTRRRVRVRLGLPETSEEESAP